MSHDTTATDPRIEELPLFDTHCHIQSIDSEHTGEASTRKLWQKIPDRSGSDVIADAAAAGVTRMICVGCDVDDSVLAVAFVQDYAGLYASIGIHPHEAARYLDDKTQTAAFQALATKPKVVAVGECGLDYYYNHSPKAAQLALLKLQIELAQTHDLPMIFHVREAFDDFWPVFDTYHSSQPIRGVLHSFTDTAVHMRQAVERGLYIGVNGIATFAKDPKQIDVYKTIPLENLLLETDAPFLTPIPYRGTICEPKHVRSTVEFLATLRGESLRQLAQTSTLNAQTLFGVE